jgi:hypothetical protein
VPSASPLAALAAALCLLAAPALAADGRTDVRVMVSRISDTPCSADERAAELDRSLREQFRYECLEVLSTTRLSLELDQVGTVSLPTGKLLRVRPLDLGSHGVLLAVGVEGVVDTDLRVRSGHLVAIGAGSHGGGKLVISLEPSF